MATRNARLAASRRDLGTALAKALRRGGLLRLHRVGRDAPRLKTPRHERRVDDDPRRINEDEPRRDDNAPKEGESLLAGRDIMGDVIAAERAEATVDHKGDCYRRPIGFNTALIVASDKYTYKARARSRSPDRVKEVVHVAPVVPSRRDE